MVDVRERADRRLGQYAVNVESGNLIVTAGDMGFAHRSLPLAFVRAYNSFSQHDYAGTDGSIASNYGNGWTNTFDAHIARNSSGGISVYDSSGDRHDFTGSDSGGYAPPAGDNTKLVYISASLIGHLKTYHSWALQNVPARAL